MLFFEEKDYTHLSNSRTCRRENEHSPKKMQQKCFSLDFTFSIKLMVKCPWITQHFLIIYYFFFLSESPTNFGMSVLATTHTAEPAAATAPVLLVLVPWPLRRLQAEVMKGFATHLTEQHLEQINSGEKKKTKKKRFNHQDS